MRAAALTCRSYFSLLRGSVAPQRWAEAAKDFGYGAVALADTNGLYGIAQFYKDAQQAGIKPIIGVEILTHTQRATLLIENEQGYRNLCRFISSLNLNKEFCLIKELAKSSDGLICICFQLELSKQLKKILPKDRLFFGCKNETDVQWSNTQKIEPVAAATYTILDNDDIIRSKIVNRVRGLSGEGSGARDDCGPVSLPSEQQLREQFKNYPKAVFNSEQIGMRCDFELFTGKYYLPKVDIANEKNSDMRLSKLCHRLLPTKYSPVSHQIIKRLEHELDVIKGNKFSDYFLVVNEIVSFAKSKDIPVEIRGSAAGSLVAHILGFTRVCPVENDLYFERFMNPGRKDCPDIDIDLCWRGRDEVIKFCYEHWGYAHVAMISTMNTYRYRGAIRDVGRYLTLQPSQIDELVENRRTNGSSAVYDLANKIVGMPRHVGIHCGGIVITPCPVGELAPLQYTNKGVIVTQYEKDAAEALGLIKIDLLGNRALSTVNEAVKLANEKQTLDIDGINQTDRKTAKLLTEGRTMGYSNANRQG